MVALASDLARNKNPDSTTPVLAEEHDACGVGKIYRPGQNVITEAIKSVCSMNHRGGENSGSGDGTGIKITLPQSFFKNEFETLTGQDIGEQRVGVGSFFISPKPEVGAEQKTFIEQHVKQVGLELAWRDVPTNQKVVGDASQETQPDIVQAIFVSEDPSLDQTALEQKLQTLKLVIIGKANQAGYNAVGRDGLSVTSLSSEKITYKGMVTARQFVDFFDDLKNPAILNDSTVNEADVHTRYSTNTAPQWALAQPFEIAHNGEINTITGNMRWARMHEKLIRPLIEDKLAAEGYAYEDISPIIPDGLSDSAVLSRVYNIYKYAGLSDGLIKTMMVPEAFQPRPHLSAEDNQRLENMYTVLGSIMQPWDGPAFLMMGDAVGLDRNGLRPGSKLETEDNFAMLMSEARTPRSTDAKTTYNKSMNAGGLSLLNKETGTILHGDDALFHIESQGFLGHSFADLAARIKEQDLKVIADEPSITDQRTLTRVQSLAGWGREDISVMLDPSIAGKNLSSMGYDAPLAFMSDEYVRLSDYLRQKFAQVTNPPVDYKREGFVFNDTGYVGSFFDRDGNFAPEQANIFTLDGPTLSNSQYNQFSDLLGDELVEISTTYKITTDLKTGTANKKRTIDAIVEQGVEAARAGKHIALTDMALDDENAIIDIWLVVGPLHKRLIKEGLRHQTTITVRNSQMINGWDFASLSRSGADGINAWLTEETLLNRLARGHYDKPDDPDAPRPQADQIIQRFYNGIRSEIKSIGSINGETTLSSTRGSFNFEVLGLSAEISEKYLGGAPNPIGGHRLENLVAKQQQRIKDVQQNDRRLTLIDTGQHGSRASGGEPHAMDETSVELIRDACRAADKRVMAAASQAAIEAFNDAYSTTQDIEAAKQAAYAAIDKSSEAVRDQIGEERIEIARKHAREKALRKGKREDEAELAADAMAKGVVGAVYPKIAHEITALKTAFTDYVVSTDASELDTDSYHDAAMAAFKTGLRARWKVYTHDLYNKDLRRSDETSGHDYAAEADRPTRLSDIIKIRKNGRVSIPLDQVEPLANLTRRGRIADMSMGALSKVSHQTLTAGAHLAGAQSGSGEGGLDSRAYHTTLTPGSLEPGPYNLNPTSHQIASGRFGAKLSYLVHADRLVVKEAQGAKPGQGGQLPGHKVNDFIADLRGVEPGTTLISPQPHHDKYSIEDTAGLIYTLQKVNPGAIIEEKLVASMNSHIVASGVVKGGASAVIVSGGNGGTGASPTGSIKYAGSASEIGTSFAHQQLSEQNLRAKAYLETDGGIRSGRELVILAMMGAEEFGFGNSVMIAGLNCLNVKKCHTNKCPVGIATQDEALIAQFGGDPESVQNYFENIFEEAREILADLGFTTFDELVGRYDLLEYVTNNKYGDLDLRPIIPEEAITLTRTYNEHTPSESEKNLDDYILEQNPDLFSDHGKIKISQSEIKNDAGKTIASLSMGNDGALVIRAKVNNSDRAIGARLSGELERRGLTGKFNDAGKKAIRYELDGKIGNYAAAFMHPDISLSVNEVNCNAAAGLSGGRLIVKGTERSDDFDINRAAGNSIGYGMTGGEVFISGEGNARLGVRRSGGVIVADSANDHASEFATGGMAILNSVPGMNYGAAMTGGIDLVRATEQEIEDVRHKGPQTIQHKALTDEAELLKLRGWLQAHYEATESQHTANILANWEEEKHNYRVVWSVDKKAPKSIAVPPPTLGIAA